jgi:hypothetical protein
MIKPSPSKQLHNEEEGPIVHEDLGVQMRLNPELTM